MPQIRLNAALDASNPPRVDRDNRTIYGVAVMTRGEAKGHGFRLNEVSQANALQLGNAAKQGVKSRLSHPNACNDTTGKHLGRAINFRESGDKLLADLKMAKAASKSPHGDLADYVMTLAEEDPAAFGMSMVIEYQLETELDEKKQPKRDASGEPLEPFAIITALKAVDVVGDPAANPGGMFSEGDDSDFAKDASALLDQIEAGSPEAFLSRADAFLRSYLSNRFGEVPQRLQSKGLDPMTAEQQKRAEEIAALCTKYLGDNAEAKTKAAAFTADEKITLDNVKDALLGEFDAKLKKLQDRREGKPADENDPAAQLAALRAKIDREERIAALCKAAYQNDEALAGKRAKELIANASLSVESIPVLLMAELGERLKAPAAGDDPLKAGDKDAKRKAELEAEYDANVSIHAQLGISKEDYVKNALADGDSPVVVIAPKKNA